MHNDSCNITLRMHVCYLTIPRLRRCELVTERCLVEKLCNGRNSYYLLYYLLNPSTSTRIQVTRFIVNISLGIRLDGHTHLIQTCIHTEVKYEFINLNFLFSLIYLILKF